MPPELRYHIFFSHATYDKFVAKTVCERVERIGLTTFRDDRDIHGGDDIPEEIVSAIESSHEVVVLFTPQSLSRTWVTLEIGMALAFRRRIVPLLYHVEAKELPDVLRLKRGYDVNQLDEFLKELRSRYLEASE